jgi:GNAT superfamily N-acetyltransferase
MRPDPLEIRECRVSDAAAVARLSEELGYAVAAGEMEYRLRRVVADRDHAVLVACLEDCGVIGWIDVGVVFHLQSGTYCEVGGLVVADGVRGKGVGRELVAHAEKWAATRGLKKVLVRSNAKRADAHRFYLRENYSLVKTSAVFEKQL